MKRHLFFIVIFISILIYHTGLAGDNNEMIFLKKIKISGNRITKTQYIMKFIDLKTSKWYKIDNLMDKMSIIKEKLFNTGLFESILYDDQIDDNNNLILTIKVKEKNYLHFGPSGYIYLKDTVNPKLGIYFDYTNLFGKNNHININVLMYKYQGLFIRYENDTMNRLRFSSLVGYLKNSTDTINVSPEILYGIFDSLNIGIGFLYNKNVGNSYIFYPKFQYKCLKDSKITLNTKISFPIGIGENSNLNYGLSSQITYKKELLLQIVSKTSVSLDYLDGNIPENLILSNKARGYPENFIKGNRRLSLSSELYAPLPWFPEFYVDAFVDSDILGYNSIKIIVSGGIGLRWYNRFFNPLSIDIAIGKGFEINFNKKL